MPGDDPQDSKPSARLYDARDLLRLASSGFLDDLLWHRLCGVATELPPLIREEEPPDLFVDLVTRDPASELSENLRRSASRVVAERLNEDRNVTALGHLLYLCSRIDAVQSIGSIQSFLDSQPRAFAEVAPGETLLLRAVRAYVGLLATEFRRDQSAYRPQNFGNHISTLEGLLRYPGCAVVAATGLIGLQPENRDELLLHYFPNDPNAQRIVNIGVRVAGFDSLAEPKYSAY